MPCTVLINLVCTGESDLIVCARTNNSNIFRIPTYYLLIAKSGNFLRLGMPIKCTHLNFRIGNVDTVYNLPFRFTYRVEIQVNIDASGLVHTNKMQLFVEC